MAFQWLPQALAGALAAREQAALLRRRLIAEPLDATHVRIAGRRLVNFASNDYLALSRHPHVVRAAQAALADGVGAGASPAICGRQPAHASAEAAIAQWKGTEAAVLLPSGYQAAHAAVQTLAGVATAQRRRLRFLIDRLSHASLIDAIGASGCPMRVFPHNGMAKLQRLLESADAAEAQVVVSESIFSMDGDAADLEALADLRRRFGFVLLLDEAHASGVYGPSGAGYASERGLSEAVDVSLATLSKAAGVVGGAVCGSRAFCEAVVNWGRAYIYSTAIPPAMAAAAEAAIDIMRNEPKRQERLRALALRLRERLSELSSRTIRGDSPIIPVILGDERAVLDAGEKLRQAGFLVGAVRPPTVPRGSARLRISLSCGHSEEELDGLTSALRQIVACVR
jgi:8-amino-7-oxononanoate synthase